jgi:uncharacterized membrane protein YhaH (DUF805 family)
MSAKELLFSAKGRIGRKDFWIASLGLAVAAIPFKLLGPFGALLSLAFLYPQVCLFAKRCHDIGKSGWLAAAQYVPPVLVALAVGFTTADGGEPPLVVAAISAIVMIACVIFYFRVGLARSAPGAGVGLGSREATDAASVFS